MFNHGFGHGFGRSHGPFGLPGPRPNNSQIPSPFSFFSSPQQSIPFSHPPPPQFGGFPGFEAMKAKFDWAVTRKVEELIPCIVNKVKNAIEGKNPEPETTSPIVHNGVTCDGCGVYPIHGIRYKCNTCPDFDFCEKCESSVEHDHNFIKMKKPRQWGDKEFFHPRRSHHSPHGHGHHGHGHHGWWRNPEHKQLKRTWKLSKVFGGEPSSYKDFVASTLELNFEELVQKYSTDNNVQPTPLSEEKIRNKAAKLAYMLQQPAESFVELIKAKPFGKCWEIAKTFKSKIQENIPESVSVVIETEPSTLIESNVEEIKSVPVVEKVEVKQVEEIKPKEEIKPVEVSKREVPVKKTKEQKAIEEITNLVIEVVGEHSELIEFVKKNWKLGADKIVELWFEQH